LLRGFSAIYLHTKIQNKGGSIHLGKYGINPKSKPWESSWRKRWTGARKSVDSARNGDYWKEPSRIQPN
jgi:hypothetical protein